MRLVLVISPIRCGDRVDARLIHDEHTSRGLRLAERRGTLGYGEGHRAVAVVFGAHSGQHFCGAGIVEDLQRFRVVPRVDGQRIGHHDVFGVRHHVMHFDAPADHAFGVGGVAVPVLVPILVGVFLAEHVAAMLVFRRGGFVQCRSSVPHGFVGHTVVDGGLVLHVHRSAFGQ